MPAKSIKQMRWIAYLRNKYKTKAETPEKWKFIWDKDWEKLEPTNESFDNKVVGKLYEYLDKQ